MWACLGIQSGPGKLPLSPTTYTRSRPGTWQPASAAIRPPGERGRLDCSSHAGPVRPGMKRIRSAANSPPSVTTLSASKRTIL